VGPDDKEAIFDSTLAFTEDADFEEQGTIVFPRRSALCTTGEASLLPLDSELRHGTVVWKAAGSDGRFEGGCERVHCRAAHARPGRPMRAFATPRRR
jgi:hypothetical protein